MFIAVLDARYMYNGPIFIKMYKDVASEDDNENDVAPEDHNENDIVKMFQNRNKAQYHFGSMLQIFACILLDFLNLNTMFSILLTEPY